MKDNLQVAAELLQQVSGLSPADAAKVAKEVLEGHELLPHGYGFADAVPRLGEIRNENDFLAAVEVAAEDRTPTSR